MGAYSRNLARRLAVSGDQTDTASPDALAKAKATFGLDVAPTFAAQQEHDAAVAKGFRDRQHARRVERLAASLGTPGDYARGLMAKTPPAEWVRDLREVSPESETASYLVFAWKAPPLDPDAGRWCLYEVIPDRLITVERRMELESAPYWMLPKDQRHGQALIVSAYQWEMYRAHRVDVRPFWCLQGTEGGTPFHYTNIEQRYLRLMGKPDSPAELGSLPYAPWDARVRAQVVARDRLVKLGGSLDRMRASGTRDALITEAERMEKEFRRTFWDYFAERLGETTELYAHFLAEDPDRPRQTEADAIAASEARDVFIETGAIPSAHRYRSRTPQFASRSSIST